MSDRISGRLKWFDFDRGYGFAMCDDYSRDVFVHAKQFLVKPTEPLKNGQRISFVPVMSEKGRAATQIAQLIDESDLEQLASPYQTNFTERRER